MFFEHEEQLDRLKLTKGELFDKLLEYKKNKQYDEFVKLKSVLDGLMKEDAENLKQMKNEQLLVKLRNK